MLKLSSSLSLSRMHTFNRILCSISMWMMFICFSFIFVVVMVVVVVVDVSVAVVLTPFIIQVWGKVHFRNGTQISAVSTPKNVLASSMLMIWLSEIPLCLQHMLSKTERNATKLNESPILVAVYLISGMLNSRRERERMWFNSWSALKLLR